jgi:hypothetical protein
MKELKLPLESQNKILFLVRCDPLDIDPNFQYIYIFDSLAFFFRRSKWYKDTTVSGYLIHLSMKMNISRESLCRVTEGLISKKHVVWGLYRD